MSTTTKTARTTTTTLTTALLVLALVLAVIARSQLVWSADALVVVVGALVAVLRAPKTSTLAQLTGALRAPTSEAVLAAGITAIVFLAVRGLSPGLALFGPLALGIGAFAWTAPVRAAVPPTVAAALGAGWLFALTHHASTSVSAANPTAGISDAGAVAKVFLAVVLLFGGIAYFARACLRSLHTVWKWAAGLVVYVAAVPLIVSWVRGLSPVNAVTVLVLLCVAAVGVATWRAVINLRRQAERERTRPMQTWAEHVSGHLGWKGSNWIATDLGEREIVRQWPDDVRAPGAVIAGRYCKGWHGSETALRMVEHATALCFGGEWAATVDVHRRWVVVTRQAEKFELPKSLAYTPGDDRDLVPLGLRDDGTPLVWDMSNQLTANALIAGPPGAGKTNALRAVVAGAARAGALVDVIDPKLGEDFELFAGHPGIRVWTEPADWLRVLGEVAAEIAVRAPTRGPERDRLPHRLLIVDETSEAYPAMAGLGKVILAEYVTSLQSIARKGRAYKIHLVLATQKPVAKSLTGDPTTGSALRDLCLFRIGLGKLSASAAQMIFDEPSAPAVEALPGRGIANGGDGLVVVQTSRLDGPEAARIAATGKAEFPREDLRIVEVPPELLRTPLPEALEEPGETVSQPAPEPIAVEHAPHAETCAEHAPTDARARVEAEVPAEHAVEDIRLKAVTELKCYRCDHGWHSSARPGLTVKCPSCGHPRRVPKVREA